MNKKIILSNISVYSASHGLVDATCAATIFAISAISQDDTQNLFQHILIYNVLAFATQPLFGLIVDSFKAPVHAAVAGISLVAISTLLLQAPILAVTIAGIGNAIFHVGGGFASLNLSPGKASLPGIYVAPGALGLAIGIWVGKSGNFIAWPFILLLAISAIITIAIPRPKTNTHHILPANLKWFEGIILLILFSIAIRGLVGMGLYFPWKSNPLLLISLTCAVVLGKALGGILGDKYGWIKVAISGLAISAPLLAFFNLTPSIAIIGAFFFNLTMPVTLVCMAEMLPGKSGFAFGLTALALIVGAWPVFTNANVFTSNQLFIFAIILISIFALYTGLRLYVRHFRDQTRTRAEPDLQNRSVV